MGFYLVNTYDYREIIIQSIRGDNLMMIDVNMIFELCLFITTYNEPDYMQNYPPYRKHDYRRYNQQDIDIIFNLIEATPTYPFI